MKPEEYVVAVVILLILAACLYLATGCRSIGPRVDANNCRLVIISIYSDEPNAMQGKTVTTDAEATLPVIP